MPTDVDFSFPVLFSVALQPALIRLLQLTCQHLDRPSHKACSMSVSQMCIMFASYRLRGVCDGHLLYDSSLDWISLNGTPLTCDLQSSGQSQDTQHDRKLNRVCCIQTAYCVTVMCCVTVAMS